MDPKVFVNPSGHPLAKWVFNVAVTSRETDVLDKPARVSNSRWVSSSKYKDNCGNTNTPNQICYILYLYWHKTVNGTMEAFIYAVS